MRMWLTTETETLHSVVYKPVVLTVTEGMAQLRTDLPEYCRQLTQTRPNCSLTCTRRKQYFYVQSVIRIILHHQAHKSCKLLYRVICLWSHINQVIVLKQQISLDASLCSIIMHNWELHHVNVAGNIVVMCGHPSSGNTSQHSKDLIHQNQEKLNFEKKEAKIEKCVSITTKVFQ